jgi:hypothetical protein
MYMMAEDSAENAEKDMRENGELNMTRLEYMEFHQSCCDKMVKLTEKKNADYCGKSEDPFNNFRRRGEHGFLVRMDDKLARIESFIEKGTYEVKDESFEDTCLDLANYAILLCGYMKAKKETAT